jgi:hypothetical protein
LLEGVFGGCAIAVRLLLLERCYARLICPRHFPSTSFFVGDRLPVPAAYPVVGPRNEVRGSRRLLRTVPGTCAGMTIGTSIFLIAVGAILAFAVDASVAGFSIQTAGVILMVAGVVGLVIGLFLLSSRRARPAERTVHEDRAGRTVYEDRPHYS